MIYYIYKLVCNDVSVTDFYIGSTSNIRNRKYQHKNCCINLNDKHYNLKIYQTIRENGGFENWRMVVLEEMIEGTTLLQSKMREEHFRLELEATLNSISCGTGLTKKEYMKDYSKTKKSKETKKEYQQTEKHKEYQKQYQQSDKYKEYKKNLYQKNKEEINEKRRLKYLAKKET